MEDEHHWSTAVCHNTADGIRCIALSHSWAWRKGMGRGFFLVFPPLCREDARTLYCPKWAYYKEKQLLQYFFHGITTPICMCAVQLGKFKRYGSRNPTLPLAASMCFKRKKWCFMHVCTLPNGTVQYYLFKKEGYWGREAVLRYKVGMLPPPSPWINCLQYLFLVGKWHGCVFWVMLHLKQVYL